MSGVVTQIVARWRGPLPARLAVAAPDVLLAAGFLVTWIAPDAFGRKAVAYLMLVMLLEFIIVHTAGFMGTVVFERPFSRRMKGLALGGLGAFYGVFAAALSVGFRVWWPLWAVLLLALNRLLLVLVEPLPDGRERAAIHRAWLVATLCYVVFALAATLLPVPSLGVTDEVVRRQALPGSGLWFEEPHRVLAFGFLYFLATGLSEVFSHRWLPGVVAEAPPSPEEPAASTLEA